MSSNLNAVIRNRHAVAQIRALPVIGVDSPAITESPDGPFAVSNVVALRPATPSGELALPVTPGGTPSTVTVATLDAGHRFAATKVTDGLGWAAGDALHAVCRPGRVVICAGLPTTPAQQTVTFDARKQLRLSPTAVAALGVGAAAQVLAVATATGELVLANAAVIAEVLTGVITTPADDTDRPAADPPALRGSRIARRWRAPQPASAPGG